MEETLLSLSLEEKAAQLLMVRASAMPAHPDSEERRALRAQAAELGVGGVVLFRSELDAIPNLIDDLQAVAKVPLWFAADTERSLGMRVPNGPVSLPDAMALGAIQPLEDAEAAARFAGELTARESRAAGIDWALAPVADVNDDPRNPVISLRSFGEDPERVAKLVAAFVEGAKGRGILTAAKHFPGHGDTAVDSHLELPVIAGDRARLDRVELAPFRAAIAAGVDAVMVGHLAVPALDPSGDPATLSAAITTKLLREELGFGGLVVTDALDMKGVGPYWMGEAVVRAIAAGADVVALPPDPRVAVQSIVRAVGEGRLTEARIDESVRRILAAKARLGLDRARTPDRRRLAAEVGRPDDVERADAIARRTITAVKNEGGIVPLRVEGPLRILQLVTSSDGLSTGTLVGEEIEKRGIEIETRRLDGELAPAAADAIVEAAKSATHVLVSAFVRPSSEGEKIELEPTHAALVDRLAAEKIPTVVASFGSPYLLRQLPQVPAYLCSYSAEESSQRAMVGALFGEEPVDGKLPVTIPGQARPGDGIAIARRDLELEPAPPEAAGFTAAGLAAVDRVVERFVAEKAFPGATLAIGRHGKLVHLKAFGRLSYEPDAAATTVDTIYDLASLTKVIVTTTLVMQMVDEGRLDLDAKVRSFLPKFEGANKEKVTVRHLLTHSSGIDWWAPLHEELEGKGAYVERIQAMPLVYEPGGEMKYSDLGIILLGEILERVSGEDLKTLASRRLLEPLGLERSGYEPPPEFLANLAPTEIDPESGKALHGVVHDENARAMGGVAPHAGLFGTAPEMAKFAQMILWKGVYANHRFVKRETVESFTRAADLPRGSSRALGWDTKSEEGSSSGVLFSPGSFGHTGFTGTSLWFDPERDLFVVLLTNRVHPTRENNRIREARPAIHDAVIRALADAPRVVRVGLDRVDAGEAPELAGKRLGLLSNSASVTLDGRRAIEVFRERGLDVVKLFSPEHGLAAGAAAGEAVADSTDAASGLPVTSLYGAHAKPTADDLAGLDALVVDLQDAGVRFYTYESSLLLALEAAAEAGIGLFVLDRPNPLGGERVQGPARATADVVRPSLLTMSPGPLLHGATLGELARFVNSRRVNPAKLQVIGMSGWKRSMTWRDTNRRWVAPSPNLRSASAALAYPGVALLEATNVSEGRGTEAPFLLFGAPWLDPSRVRIEVPGYRFLPATFTPQASPAAPEPRYRDVECRGFRVEVTDPALADPWRLGVELLAALSRQPGFEWIDGGAALAALTGSPETLETVRRAAASKARWDAAPPKAVRDWRLERRSALLYD